MIYNFKDYERGTSPLMNNQNVSEQNTQNQPVTSAQNGSHNTNPVKNRFKNLVDKISTNGLYSAIVGGLIVAIVMAALSAVVGFATGLFKVSSRLDNIDEKIETLNETTEKIQEEIADLDVIRNDIQTMKEDVKELEDNVGDLEVKVTSLESYTMYMNPYATATRVIPTDTFVLNSQPVYYEELCAYIIDDPEWTASDIIATDLSTNDEYSASDLANQKILVPYTSGNQEIYFCGQFNENNQWDGNCVINIYENNQLILIMDASYDNGTLISYKQVIPFTTNRDKKIWSISNRICEGELNSGESFRYSYKSDYTKDFSLNDVKVDDLYNVDEFMASLDSTLEGYYYGATSNGEYNDNSGDAYLINFFDNGTVRTLYKGEFKDGEYNDLTGNAWYITKEEDTQYMYYIGKFEDGHPVDKANDDNFINPISINEINNIIADEPIPFDLTWDNQE